jgi:hypothetical protein
MNPRLFFKTLGKLFGILVLAMLYGALWNRFPNSFPAPPEAWSDWIASHFLTEFNLEEQVDLLVFFYSCVLVSAVSLLGYGLLKLLGRRG